jgi:hypothetical protein
MMAEEAHRSAPKKNKTFFRFPFLRAALVLVLRGFPPGSSSSKAPAERKSTRRVRWMFKEPPDPVLPNTTQSKNRRNIAWEFVVYEGRGIFLKKI